MSWRRRAVAMALLLTCVGTGLPSPAAADYPLDPDGMKLEVIDTVANPDNRAGIHPDRLLTRLIPSPGANGKDLEIAFPAGMGGNPTSVPLCTRVEFDAFPETKCPPETQVGAMISVTDNGHEALPIYNLETQPGEVVAFGAQAGFLRFKFEGHLRRQDFGLTTRVESLPQMFYPLPAHETIFEFWGIPADHQQGTSIPRRPFLTTPTRCDRGPLAVTVRQTTWQRPDEYGSGTVDTGLPLVGCQLLPFSPRATLALENPVADSPTGFDLGLKFPENADVDSLASAQMRSSTIVFPAGMGISAAAATALGACSDAELARDSARPAACPASAKVGTVEIGAPQLRAPLTGTVYLGEESRDTRFRLFVVAADKATGIETKFVGTMRPDPESGRFTAILDDLPELALSSLTMRFDGGRKALFLAPSACGPATIDVNFVPTSGGPVAKSSDSVQIGPRGGRRCGETAPFQPTLKAAISARQANGPTSFSTAISRRDGDQPIDRFSLVFPPGLSAGIGSVELCPQAQIAAGSCGAASRIGSAYVDIGAGTETAQLSGDAFLTGPYRRDPFGVALAFAAKLGPFNLGTFVVQSGMRFDPVTSQVSVRTDSLPQSFEGVPVSFQTIGLEIDRPGFMRAPTSCDPKPVAATITSAAGAVAQPSSEISVRGCVGLPFRPALTLALSDREQLRRLGKPGLRIGMRTRKRDANLSSMAMLMPPALKLSAGSLGAICARQVALRGTCPKAAQVGTGIAHSPLLREPLKGEIYVVQPKGAGEPDLWTTLRGQGIELNMRSTSKTVRGRVETSFNDLPDMPLSSFEMRLGGGADGLFSLRRNICAERAPRLDAAASLTGQNGAARQQRVAVALPKTCRVG